MIGPAGAGHRAPAEDWLASPYLERLVTRVAAQHHVPPPELPDLVQETRIAVWRLGPGMLTAALVASIARHKAVDLVRSLARQRSRRLADGATGHAPNADPELQHLLSLRVAALPRRLRDFYALHYELGLSEREIARTWGLCRASVRWLDRRCRCCLVGEQRNHPESPIG